MSSGRFYLPVIVIVGFGQLIGCSAVTGTSGSSRSDAEAAPDAQTGEPLEPSDDPLPDFAVVDVNADSPRYQDAVSPRDYLGQISAWYFGSST